MTTFALRELEDRAPSEEPAPRSQDQSAHGGALSDASGRPIGSGRERKPDSREANRGARFSACHAKDGGSTNGMSTFALGGGVSKEGAEERACHGDGHRGDLSRDSFMRSSLDRKPSERGHVLD
ncbi:hypothetical protein EYF80_029354 [Liparis tanakae]|uniref:Uncharacterized protein n=1 Tax=Liparis tanakae TaxID=230148 RepID=A0A4Z2H671_9TELE|nr:hypothetical protein EYF80_029354 [Liparis tanakae]